MDIPNDESSFSQDVYISTGKKGLGGADGGGGGGGVDGGGGGGVDGGGGDGGVDGGGGGDGATLHVAARRTPATSHVVSPLTVKPVSQPKVHSVMSCIPRRLHVPRSPLVGAVTGQP